MYSAYRDQSRSTYRKPEHLQKPRSETNANQRQTSKSRSLATTRPSETYKNFTKFAIARKIQTVVVVVEHLAVAHQPYKLKAAVHVFFFGDVIVGDVVERGCLSLLW